MNSIIKRLQPTNDAFIQFTEEEILEIGIKQGDKFTVKPQEDGSFFLEKMVNLELDLAEFSEDIKDMLIFKSIKEQLPVDDIIRNILTDFINTLSETQND